VVLCIQVHNKLFFACSFFFFFNLIFYRSSQFTIFEMSDFHGAAIAGIKIKKCLWLDSVTCMIWESLRVAQKV